MSVNSFTFRFGTSIRAASVKRAHPRRRTHAPLGDCPARHWKNCWKPAACRTRHVTKPRLARTIRSYLATDDCLVRRRRHDSRKQCAPAALFPDGVERAWDRADGGSGIYAPCVARGDWSAIPEAMARPRLQSRGCETHYELRDGSTTTFVPTAVRSYRSTTSSLVMRMQPAETF